MSINIKSVIILLTLSLISLSTPISAQKSNDPGKLLIENVFLFTDRDIYVSGEQIWFNAFCTTDGKFNEQTISKIICLELINDSKESVSRNKFTIINGKISSFIEIPEDLETGVYNLTAYTQYMRNFSGFETNTMSILIINPMKKGAATLLNKIQIVEDTLIQTHENKNDLALRTSKKIYARKEFVELNITDSIFQAETKNLFITVVKKGALNNYALFNPSNIKARPGMNSYDNFKYIPEIRNLTLRGKVTNKENGSPVIYAKVYASVIDGLKQMNMALTDTFGEFTMTLNSLYDDRHIYLCTDNQFPNSRFTVYDSFSGLTEPFKPACCTIDSVKIDLIKEIYLNYQISKLFKEKSKNYPANPDSSITLFENPEIKVIIDDYIKLPTLLEVFEEIVPFVKVKKSNGIYSFTIYDDKNKINLEEPLVFYDQVPVFNMNELLKIKPKYIDRIEVINRQYIIGNYSFNGLIFIQSKTGKILEYNLPENSLITKFKTLNFSYIKYYPDYNAETNENERSPDFRTLLYMNTASKMKDHMNISFFTSNEISEYDVFVRGISNSGKLFFGKTSFRVE